MKLSRLFANVLGIVTAMGMVRVKAMMTAMERVTVMMMAVIMIKMMMLLNVVEQLLGILFS